MPSKGRRCAAVAAVVFCAIQPAAAADGVFYGTISPELTPSAASGAVICNDSVMPLGLPVPKDARVSAGSLQVFTTSVLWRIPLVLIEPRDGTRPYVYVDENRDGTFSPAERFPFARTRRRSMRGIVRVGLASVPGAPFEKIPIELALPDKDLGPEFLRDQDRVCLLQSMQSLVTATVRIDGRDLFFRYSLRPDVFEVDANTGYQAVDNGRLDEDPLSPLHGAAGGDPLVFRIGTRYVSTEVVELKRRTVVIRSREPADYRRLEWRVGLAIPDFSFQDLDGRPRRLSEFRGRFVLLNIWSLHCGPCNHELTYLKAAETRFGARGLTVLGLNTFGSPDDIRGVANPSGTTWIEARADSVHRLIVEWFQIFATPTPFLLDTGGRVIAVETPHHGRSALRGEQLLKTLDKTLPRD